MTKMMKLSITVAAAVAIGGVFAGDWLVSIWAMTAGIWMLLHNKADQRADAAEAYANDLAWLLTQGAQVHVHQITLDDVLAAHSETHRPISVGGIRPHMCVCGKPIEDHTPYGG